MAILLMIVALLILPLPGSAQELRISLVQANAENASDQRVRSLFHELGSYLEEAYPSYPYEGVEVIGGFGYESPCPQIERGTIATITPLKYLKCQEQLSDTLLPMFVVKKAGEDLEYYTAFFISKRGGAIGSIDDPEIAELYLVSPSSTSGYLAPLVKLWEAGLIKEPTVAAAEARGWDVTLVGSHRAVESRVANSDFALGGVGQHTGQVDPVGSPVQALLRYSLIPQDVVAVSADLAPYRDVIKEWFEEAMLGTSGEALAASSSQISALVPFGSEHRNAYADLAMGRRRVEGELRSFRVGDVDSISVADVAGFVSALPWKMAVTGIVAFLSAVSAVFWAGAKWGPVLQKMLREREA